MRRSLYSGLLIVAFVVAAGLIGWWVWQSSRPMPSRDQVLYDKHCAVCHGLSGDGKGDAAYLLQPKPRNFRAGRFRLVSSVNLQPTREDLFETITQGMPGTPMPSWAHLPESDRWTLADYVLKLNRDGWYERGLELGYSQQEAESYAEEMIDPGDPIAIPPEPPVTPAGVRQGRRHYLTACANCHERNGEGRRDPTWRTSEGFPTWSRNLREGVFKSGRDGKQLYIMFSTGLPGTPMPSQTLTGEQIWRVVQYVQSLSDPAAQELAEIRTKQLVAKRIEALPAAPDDSAWDDVPEVRIPLMALWWHEGFIDAVRVKAVHDGQRLAFRLEWADSTGDVQGVRQTTFPDGAAVQLTADSSPPLFAMGATGEPVNLWHWKALWSEDRQQFQDVATAFPQMAVDGYYGEQKGWRSGPLEDTTFLPAQAAHNLIASPRRPGVVEDANAAGLGTVTSQSPDDQNVEGVSRWQTGVWRLQLSRALQATGGKDVQLQPGGQGSVAFAVWNGSAGDRNGQKSVSIWNTLILE
ncbi:MAG: ethylbenzene dehydrogenase-related protein [Acidobacteriota bacterium]